MGTCKIWGKLALLVRIPGIEYDVKEHARHSTCPAGALTNIAWPEVSQRYSKTLHDGNTQHCQIEQDLVSSSKKNSVY